MAGSGWQIYVSTNLGVTWTPHGPQLKWSSLACSADGRKLVAGTSNDYIYISTDGGVNWRVTRSPAANWTCVASSADGTRLVATTYGGGIYTWYPTALSIGFSAPDLTLSWPTNVPGFILQSSTQFPTVSWQNLTNIPSVVGQQYQVIIAPSSSNEVFRLMYP